MQFEKDLLWRLTKFRDLSLKRFPLNWIAEDIFFDFALICHWVEDVVILDRALLDAEDQINPEM